MEGKVVTYKPYSGRDNARFIFLSFNLVSGVQKKKHNINLEVMLGFLRTERSKL